MKEFSVKKTLLIFFVFFVLISSLFFILLFTDATSFQKKDVFVVIKKGDYLSDVRAQIQSDSAMNYGLVFDLFAYGAEMLGYKLAYGKYQIVRGMSTFDIISVLYGRKQYTIRLTIGKHREWSHFIRFVKRQIPIDSAVFADELLRRAARNVLQDTSLLLTYIIPDTYYLYWTTSTSVVVSKLYARYLRFWNEDRLAKCKQQKLSPQQAYIIASLVEEETIHDEDKLFIASVYLNRYRKRMYLGSCPTVKYALKRFDLKRVLYKHLNVKSPFNTYRHLGLPPGPICIPSIKTIDAVLNAPKTTFLYFVADSKHRDKHLFSTTYKEHLRKAKTYVNKIFRK